MNNDFNIFLETNRLILRNLKENDLNTMYDYRNNDLCSKYQRGQIKTKEGILNLINTHKNDDLSVNKKFIIAIEVKDYSEMIGEIVVMPVEKTISLGYTLSYKYHRKWYAYEALSFLINLLHQENPEYEFISFTDKDNIASINLLKKLGYKYFAYSEAMDSEVFGKFVKVNPFEI